MGNVTGSAHVFRKAGGNDAVTIDSSGNLMVGNTDSTPYDRTSGNAIALGDGLISSAQEGGNAAIFNRMTSDGSIVGFRKDGSPVGSIGANGGMLTVGGGDCGLYFEAGTTNVLFPYNPSTSSTSDNDITIGWSSNRFKDLYLSGGAYLGGTGSANKLDDYEEGTWTPQAGNWTGTYSTQIGNYTKIGNTLHLWFQIIANGGTGSFGNTWLTVQNLPFSTDVPGSVINGWWNVLNAGTTSVPHNGYFDNTFPNYAKDSGSTDGIGNYETSYVSTSNNWQMRGCLIVRTT
jgi:hypothetical protein